MRLNLGSGLLLFLATSQAVGAHSWFSKAGMVILTPIALPRLTDTIQCTTNGMRQSWKDGFLTMVRSFSLAGFLWNG